MSLEQWETYYRGGGIATCPTGPDGGYDLEVRDAWVQFFSMLPDGARILDVGTGNGVVAQIAAETARSQGLHWEIHGTDLARIDPHVHVADGARRLAGITFHAEVATEHLPFDGERFDAVCGHYALEYTDIPAALAEIHRVLKPGGNAQFIIHHADSMLLRSARLTLRESNVVLKETDVFRKLHRLVTMDQVEPGVIQQASDELTAAIRVLKQEMEQSRLSGTGLVFNVVLDAVQKLLAARKDMGPARVGLEVDRAEQEMRDSVQRLDDLIGHARSPQDMEAVEQDAAAAGFSLIERLPQYHAGSNLVGWHLLMHRP